MIVDKIFPISIHTFQYDRLDEIPTLINLIENNITHKVSIGMTPSNLHKMQETQNLVQFFNASLEEYRNYYQYDCEKISITTMWGNMTDAMSGDRHHQHKHPLSFVSGVFYLSTGSNTVFFNPSNLDMFHVWKKNNEYEYIVEPKVGQLILFPSTLDHCTKPHTDSNHRHTISINTIPAGKVNEFAEDRATTWEVEVK
jgi:uncharacterized protein (TIGR02466 family)